MTKILLVEDDKSLREIYGVRLMAEGYEIVSAGDGEEALAMAIKEHPQLIVSDVMMPKISGFDMLDILRSTSETKDIKVIMMTALSSEDQRARGESLGADRYLVKSQVGIEDVVRTVHEVMGDSISTPQTASQAFATPVPSATQRPATSAPPRQPGIFASIPAATNPSQPTPEVSPIPSISQPVVNTPQPQVQPTAPVAPPTQPTPTSNPLPQPTAPFSSPRPGSLGDRVISPLSNQPPAQDIASLMNQELNNTNQQTVPQPMSVPVPSPQPLQVPAPQAMPPRGLSSSPNLDDTQLPPTTPQ